MKNLKHLTIAAVIIAVVAFMWCSTPVQAADEMTMTPDRILFKVDKNGKEYAVLIFSSEKTSPSGMKYQDSIVGTIPAWETSALAAAKTLKPGQPVRMIATTREYNGSPTLRIKAISAVTTAKK
jgi:hypothetical protein